MPKTVKPDYPCLLRNDDLKWLEDVDQQLQRYASPDARQRRSLKEVETLMKQPDPENIMLCALHSLITQHDPAILMSSNVPEELMAMFENFASLVQAAKNNRRHVFLMIIAQNWGKEIAWRFISRSASFLQCLKSCAEKMSWEVAKVKLNQILSHDDEAYEGLSDARICLRHVESLWSWNGTGDKKLLLSLPWCEKIFFAPLDGTWRYDDSGVVFPRNFVPNEANLEFQSSACHPPELFQRQPGNLYGSSIRHDEDEGDETQSEIELYAASPLSDPGNDACVRHEEDEGDEIQSEIELYTASPVADPGGEACVRHEEDEGDEIQSEIELYTASPAADPGNDACVPLEDDHGDDNNEDEKVETQSEIEIITASPAADRGNEACVRLEDDHGDDNNEDEKVETQSKIEINTTSPAVDSDSSSTSEARIVGPSPAVGPEYVEKPFNPLKRPLHLGPLDQNKRPRFEGTPEWSTSLTQTQRAQFNEAFKQEFLERSAPLLKNIHVIITNEHVIPKDIHFPRLYSDYQVMFELVENAAFPEEDEALFVTEEKASSLISDNADPQATNVPIFIDPSSGTSRRSKNVIADMFTHISTDEDKKDIEVQQPLEFSCLNASCFKTKTVGDVRKRFVADSSEESEYWNCLDMSPAMPGTQPSFLYRGRNDALRWHAVRRINAGNSAGRSNLSLSKDNAHWMLLAQSGAITLPHEDGFGEDSYLINHDDECIGYGWISRPSYPERRLFSSKLIVPQEKARFNVLRYGEGVFFQAGTIHFVFRLPFSKNTLVFGGHTLRWSGIENSLKVALRHLTHPNATNESLQKHNLLIFTEIKSMLEHQSMDSIEIEWVGGLAGKRRLVRLFRVRFNTLFNSICG
jgi:hypothetical protein